MDLVALYPYDPTIRNSIENGTAYSFSIPLDELYRIIPRPRKAKDRYKAFIRFLEDKGITMNIANK